MCNKLMLTLAALVAGSTLFAQKANFIDNDWQAARQQSVKENKLLFVDAYTDWCGWCKVMDREVFPNPEVAELMNKNFVNLKMEMEHSYGVKLSMKYNVSMFPTYLIFNPEGRLVYTLMGYNPAPQFLDTLKQVIAGTNLHSYPGISTEVELPFPEFYAKAFGTQREWADSATVSQYLQKQDDLYTEVNALVLLKFYTSVSTGFQKYLLENRTHFAELYGNGAIDLAVSALYQKKIDAAIKTNDLKVLSAALNEAQTNLPDFNPRAKQYYFISFYLKNQDWKNFTAGVDKYLAMDTTDKGATINQLSWTVYEKVDDAAVIEKAIGWMKGVVTHKKEYATMDTYAALLYKGKKYKEAEKAAKDAIAIGNQNGENVKSTEELLQKIKQAR